MPHYDHQRLDYDYRSDSDSISSWLESHPDLPHQYLHEDSIPPGPSIQRKRQPSHAQEYTTRLGKRVKLFELPASRMNARSSHHEHYWRDASPSKSPSKPAFKSPSRVRNARGKADTPAQTQTPAARWTRSPQRATSPVQNVDDPEATPRPPSNHGSTREDHPCADLNQLPAPTFPPLRPSQRGNTGSVLSTTSSDLSEDSGLTSASRGRRREGSPKKPTRMADFLLSDTPVVIKDFGTPGYPIPNDVKPLYKDLASIAAGRHVIPIAMQDIAMDDLLDETFPENFMSHWMQQERGEHILTGGSGYMAFWVDVLKILNAARECFNAKLPEASWNSEVHSTILNLALSGSWKSNGVWYRDVTSAKITDKALLPTYARGDSMQSKMVDYVLVLNPDSDGDLQARIVAKITSDQMNARTKAEQKSSINHTDAEYLWFSPVAVSMETKRGAVDEDNMRVQISLWVSAHFARLRQLNEKGQLLSLPILVMQGHKWKFMIAQVKDNMQIVILGDRDLGDTSSVKGIFQLIAAVRRLADWVHDDYLPWFKCTILVVE